MTRPPPKAFIHRAGRDAEEAMPEVRHVVTSTQLAFVYGLILGSLPEAEAQELFQTLDSLVRLSKLEGGHYYRGSRVIAKALAEAGLLDAPDPPVRRQAVSADEKRRLLKEAGWKRQDRSSMVSGVVTNVERWREPARGPWGKVIDYHSPVSLNSAWKTYLKERSR